jgi:hypothetical protein
VIDGRAHLHGKCPLIETLYLPMTCPTVSRRGFSREASCHRELVATIKTVAGYAEHCDRHAA